MTKFLPDCPPADWLYTRAEMVALEKQLMQRHKIPAIRLMRRAAEAAFKLARHKHPNARRYMVFCGSGNNGGDGWVLATLAADAGIQVVVVTLAQPKSLHAEAAQAYTFAQEHNMDCMSVQNIPSNYNDADLLVDAMLGTGLSREVTGDYRLAIEWINRASIPVLSLDIPSGLGADTGQVMGAEAVRATTTISFVGQKRGVLTGLGPNYSGERHCDSLGLADKLHKTPMPQCALLRPCAIAPRPATAHKGKHGHVLVVGGNVGTAGAALMAGTAALRVGAGLVTVVTPERSALAFVGARPELMTHCVRNTLGLEPLLERATAIVAGPGFGQDAWAARMLDAVSRSNLPLVLDAEALRMLARTPKLSLRSKHLILTPHPGEAATLLETSVQAVQDDRFAATEALRKRYHATVILKGAGTILSAGKDQFMLCDKGNAGMGSGGMGDVLSGAIGGLLTQQDIYADAQNVHLHRIGLAVYLHSWAADEVARVSGERGLLAMDVCERFPTLLTQISRSPLAT